MFIPIISTVPANMPGGISAGPSWARPTFLSRDSRGVSRARAGRAGADVNRPGKAFLTQDAAPAGSAREGSPPLAPGAWPSSLPAPCKFLHGRSRPCLHRLSCPASAPGGLGAARVTCRPHGKDPAKVTRRHAVARPWLAGGRGLRLRSLRTRRESWFFSLWAP